MTSLILFVNRTKKEQERHMIKKNNQLFYCKHFRLLFLIISIVVLWINSCKIAKLKEDKAFFNAVISSTDIRSFESTYFSLPIDTHTVKSQSYAFDEAGYAVLRGVTLHDILDSIDSVDSYILSCNLLRILLDQEAFYVSPKAYEKLKPFIISAKDAQLYLKMDSRKLYKMINKRNDNSDFWANSYDPSYKNRCIIHHFFNKGFEISINDEVGTLSMYR